MNLSLKLLLFLLPLFTSAANIVVADVSCAIRRTDYAGNKTYVDGQLDKILLPNGYIKNGRYHFYLRDHLGNNRVVMTKERITIGTEPSDGLITLPSDSAVMHGGAMQVNGGLVNLWRPVAVQRTDYYPSGLPFPNMLNPQEQPYKYNGKKFDTMLGLNMYDQGARHYDAAIMRWHVPDALAEKYYSISPYSYAGNNPVNFIDINGDSLWITHRAGFLGLGGEETLFYENGNLFNKDKSAYTGEVKGFLYKTVSALDQIRNGCNGTDLVNQVQSSKNNITISRGSNSYSFELKMVS